MTKASVASLAFAGALCLIAGSSSCFSNSTGPSRDAGRADVTFPFDAVGAPDVATADTGLPVDSGGMPEAAPAESGPPEAGGADTGGAESGTTDGMAPEGGDAQANPCANAGGVPPVCGFLNPMCCTSGQSCVPDLTISGNADQCCLGSGYTLLDPGDGAAETGRVRDNATGLVWARFSGPQNTWSGASTYCASKGLRLPTEAEGLALAAIDDCCAFGWHPACTWTTWTSTEAQAGVYAYAVTSVLNSGTGGAAQGLESSGAFGALCVE